ncbi:4-oxalomesaconate tautomerase [Microbacterium sp. AK009]|uniref:4-oxalomesaconate tautomerase n=1 Tax=Microbacterium sp. AK009 TaxID=2723068 RepID=UPI00184F561F|nr:4-oxalomesaconate tautomerase [Microbacterium sp. AK009]NYF18532.1 4-oxalomesaconate tautomerase [Microbacterium sp. AK009]
MGSGDGIRCMLLRGGTSKGAYFVAVDVPADAGARDDLLLRIMGSPDARQIDGLGGAHPLTSKVAIVSRSSEPDVDVDYLFLQIGVDEPTVGTTQTCGNLLAGVGPFAVERGLVDVHGDHAVIRIRLVNTGDVATATFPMENGLPRYDGDASIDGVPGTAAPIELESGGIRPLLPTGNATDVVAGRTVTLVDNGMPVVLLRPEDVGATGGETPEELEADDAVRAAVEEVRLAAGPLMGLGEVTDQTVPKMILVSPPTQGGAVSTRAFIPHRVHSSIGVLMAASVAAGICVPGTVAADVARRPDGEPADGLALDVEHPSGILTSRVRVAADEQGHWHAASASLRTARKIFDGTVFPRPRR